MIALLRKELRALTGVLVVSVLVISGDLISRPISERLDELTWVTVASDLGGDAGAYAFALLILGLIAAYAAYPREHEDRTIEFLYTLPLSRARVFLTKAGSGLLVLWLAVGMGALTNGLLIAPNTQSFVGEQWSFQPAMTALFLRGCFVSVIYGYGILASFLRRFGLIPFFALAMVVVRLAEISPAFELLDPSNIMSYQFVGSAIEFPFTLLAIHIPLSLIALALGGLLWTRAGDQLSGAFERARGSVGGRLGLGCGTAGVVLTAIVGVLVALIPWDDVEDPNALEEPTAEYVSFATAEAETEHFHFTYPVSLRHRALPLVERSEALLAELRRVMELEGEIPKITVDLTDQSAGHLGIAAWTKVRVSLIHHEAARDVDRTFVHEVTHAIQHTRSDLRLGDYADFTGFFAEGSAEYLALTVVEGEDKRTEARRIAAASWERHRIEHRTLLDGPALRREHDFRLEYALGEVWTAALCDLYGDRAVAQVLDSLARPDAPDDLGAEERWRDILQAAGYSIEAVRNRWEELLLETAEEERAFIDALPELGGGVAGGDGDTVLLITLDREVPDDIDVVVAVRPGASAEDSSIRDFTATLRPDRRRAEVIVPSWIGTGRQFDFLPGLRPEGSHWAYFETWRTASR
ncbi:MAG: ABC transporter permease [Myxococcota bacterium]